MLVDKILFLTEETGVSGCILVAAVRVDIFERLLLLLPGCCNIVGELISKWLC